MGTLHIPSWDLKRHGSKGAGLGAVLQIRLPDSSISLALLAAWWRAHLWERESPPFHGRKETESWPVILLIWGRKRRETHLGNEAPIQDGGRQPQFRHLSRPSGVILLPQAQTDCSCTHSNSPPQSCLAGYPASVSKLPGLWHRKLAFTGLRPKSFHNPTQAAV